MRYDPNGYPIFPGDRGYSSCGGEVDRFDNQEKGDTMTAQDLVDVLLGIIRTHGSEIQLLARNMEGDLDELEISDVQLGVSKGGLSVVWIDPSSYR